MPALDNTFESRLETALLQSCIPLTQAQQAGGGQKQRSDAFAGVATCLVQAPDREAFRRGCYQVLDAYQCEGAPAGLAVGFGSQPPTLSHAAKLAFLAAVREAGANSDQIDCLARVFSGSERFQFDGLARPEPYTLDWPQPEVVTPRSPRP